MLKTFVIATALLASTSAFAGKTPSQTVNLPITAAEACDAGTFDYALSYLFSEWVSSGIVKDYEFGNTPEQTDAFIKAWNAKMIASAQDGNVVPGLIIADANQFIRFVAGDAFAPEEQGEWVFLYKDGCYVSEFFVPANLPVNPTPQHMTVDPSSNDSTIKPGSSFKTFREDRETFLMLGIKRNGS